MYYVKVFSSLIVYLSKYNAIVGPTVLYYTTTIK